MQSETADFAPGTATWRTGPNIRVVSDTGLFDPLYVQKLRRPQKRKYITYNIAVTGGLSHAHRQGTVGLQKIKFGEFWTCGFRDMRTDRHTDKQTDREILYRHADRNTSHPYCVQSNVTVILESSVLHCE